MRVFLIIVAAVLILGVTVALAVCYRRARVRPQGSTAEITVEPGVSYFAGEVARLVHGQENWLVVGGVPTRLTRAGRHRYIVDQLVSAHDWPLQANQLVTLLVTLVDPELPLQTYEVFTTTDASGQVLTTINHGELLPWAFGNKYDGHNLTGKDLRTLADKYVEAWNNSSRSNPPK